MKGKKQEFYPFGDIDEISRFLLGITKLLRTIYEVSSTKRPSMSKRNTSSG